ncbi:MAG: protein translocase subunit yajC [Candidatus Electronema aureum]|uniref:Sec translocon accessory complex subunit YajC n=1 Tax=Candidatus Electronema aureum TaxID=2005002 RepID=A0A521G191_9BACT|nr:MAG: protein translocase subunit yajC [Candidatus Electronema aureum]
MAGIAYAQSAAAAAPAAGGFASFGQFVPLILIFVVFYFLLIRPQQKKAQELQSFLGNLQKGDKVMTGGGVHGTITGLTDTAITLEIADNVRIKLQRGYVLPMPIAEEKQAAPTKKG